MSDDILHNHQRIVRDLETLNQDQLRDDIEFLLYAFRKGYGGVFVHERSAIATTEERLAHLMDEPSNLNSSTLCKAIADIFQQLPDNHLQAKRKNKRCGTLIARTPAVGNNLAPSFKEGKYPKPWKLTWFEKGSRRFPVLSITQFVPSEDALWNGFEDTYKSLAKEKVVIIDLRGNGGGDDSTAFKLANWLYGGAVPMQAETRIRRRSPEAIALQLNRMSLAARTSPQILESSYYKELQFDYGEARAHRIPEFQTDSLQHKREAATQARRFEGALYILVDSACGSSCESGLDGLRSHPNAVVVGENTAGTLQFGNVGVVTLLNSGIKIQLGTHFIRYRNNMMYEKVGFAPDLNVAPGKDALEVAIEHFANR